MSRNNLALVALASLLLLTWLAVAVRLAPLESDIAARVDRALASHAITGLRMDVRGRDVYLGGDLSERHGAAHVAAVAAAVWGVRAVDVTGLTRSVEALDSRDPLNPRFDTARIERVGGDLSNPMDPGTCQRTLARLSADGSIRFVSAGASPMLDSYPQLNDLAKVAYQCPDARILIGGHTDASGASDANLRLSEARARAVAGFFQLAGIPAERLAVRAYGDTRPVASNATPEGRALNRRITFEVQSLR